MLYFQQRRGKPIQTILEFLGSDHRACDALLASAEEAVAQQDWKAATSLFDRFQAARAHHFAMEEAVLFPAFEARTGQSGGPTQVMRMEHEQMRGLIRDMARDLEPPEPMEKVLQALALLRPG
ncbi:MAG: hemerythrin domain-containing protein [Thiobacillus sp.]